MSWKFAIKRVEIGGWSFEAVYTIYHWLVGVDIRWQGEFWLFSVGVGPFSFVAMN